MDQLCISQEEARSEWAGRNCRHLACWPISSAHFCPLPPHIAVPACMDAIPLFSCVANYPAQASQIHAVGGCKGSLLGTETITLHALTTLCRVQDSHVLRFEIKFILRL
jgi:hypothetical protein